MCECDVGGADCVGLFGEGGADAEFDLGWYELGVIEGGVEMGYWIAFVFDEMRSMWAVHDDAF